MPLWRLEASSLGGRIEKEVEEGVEGGGGSSTQAGWPRQAIWATLGVKLPETACDACRVRAERAVEERAMVRDRSRARCAGAQS